MRSRLFYSFVIAAGIVLVGGVAVASVPDSSGVIHGCRKANGGDLTVIDTGAGQSCPGGYVPLNWSQTGPQGATGVTGPTGAAGVSGYQVVTASASPVEVATGLWVAGPADAACPTGKVPLGGGGQTGNVVTRLVESFPNGTSWRATASGPDAAFQLNVYAICAAVT